MERPRAAAMLRARGVERRLPMRALILMAKAPRPGLSKTRLARGAGLDDRAAARLSRAFWKDTLAHMRAVDAERFVAFTPVDAEAELRALDPRARFVAQPDAEFGARVAAAFDAAFASGCERALVLGVDTPQLRSERLEEAFAALERADCVLGPAEDGGYYLLGLRAPAPALFEGVAWSSERVYADTLARARVLGLAVAELEREFDVDEARDLERLRALVAREGAARCPETARELALLPFGNGPDDGTR